MDKVVLRVPATTANLGPGFDTLGMALSLFNQFEFSPGESGFHVETEGEGAGKLPQGKDNLVMQAFLHTCQVTGSGEPSGLHIKIVNAVPVTSGMGSSATAIVAGIVAANTWLGHPLDEQALLDLATSLEGHPDNIAPALLGGIVASTVGPDGVHAASIRPPAFLDTVVAVPDFALDTREARRILPNRITREDAVFNVGRVALLVAALATERLELLQVAMEDRLHQACRAELIPGMTRVIKEATKAGALAATLSGAGPSLIAFIDKRADCAEHVGLAMQRAFSEAGVKARIFHMSPAKVGALHSIEAIPGSLSK